MNQAAKVHDTSMEEILASIRRIIADDEPVGAEPASPATALAADMAAADDDAMPVGPDAPANDSTPPSGTSIGAAEGVRAGGAARAVEPADVASREVPAPAAPPVRSAERPANVAPREPPPAVPTPATPHLATPLPPAPPPVTPPQAAAATPSQAAAADPTRVAAPPPPRADRVLLPPYNSTTADVALSSLAQAVLARNSRTLDDLVRDMLKPMLKAWLDDNLPNIVERLVRAEIERVSRGRG